MLQIFLKSNIYLRIGQIQRADKDIKLQYLLVILVYLHEHAIRNAIHSGNKRSWFLDIVTWPDIYGTTILILW